MQRVRRRHLVAQTQGIPPEIADREASQRIRIASGEARQVLDGVTVTAQQCLIGKPDVAAEIRARCRAVSSGKSGHQRLGWLKGIVDHLQRQRLRDIGPRRGAR